MSTILAIDDEVQNLEMVEYALDKEYEVIPVRSGKAALDYLREHSCDEDLIERFFDSYNISILQLCKRTKEDGQQSTHIEDQKLEDYTKKYSCFCDAKGRFSDYWWAGKSFSFKKLSNQTRFKSNYMYKYTCEITHMSFLNSFLH